ncbi:MULTISPECIES: bifunctional enoyl-CoA hydratase/phosphate acetyltransferase [Sphingobium]|uniref:Bifunctional enoyl-CoA hydratase/phosphate acetyltransferase n=2 Tax=Sphingobium TaxID=165695 RepID=A0A9X7YFI3_SPHYA|nr:bifunctional enoyl-CoA hydratase/phosphate acetyltransferase [Sphingobium yanoikuyae]QNG48730.1 bifunctional enoyl-CoA hydratase/phosphate acetyltransferase [Sphingobium yanoikuyae]
MNNEDQIENRTYDEIRLGDTASLTRTLTAHDVQLFALSSGDSGDGIAHGAWTCGLISALIGTELPGAGTAYLSQSFDFARPVAIGDAITATLVVTEKRDNFGSVLLDCQCRNAVGETVLAGRVEVQAPREKIRRARMAPPDIVIPSHDRYRHLIEQTHSQSPLATAVAHPCSPQAIAAAAEAAEAGLIAPILIGPEKKLRSAAEEAGCDISAFRLVAADHSHDAAARAVELVRCGEAGLLMKGSLHTDELMSAVINAASGLRTERRISHAYVMDVPGHPVPLIITDAAVNIMPSLKDKADIIRNAIDLAHVIGLAEPRVAILSAVETVNPDLPSTLDAAALCKMADRGQIVGGVLDGPLAFDNAISEAAAREKGIASSVAGKAEILVVPNIEAGNMLAKQLTFLGGADAAGVVLGARVPIVLTSRADSLRTRLASCAIAVLLARAAPKAAPGPLRANP